MNKIFIFLIASLFFAALIPAAASGSSISPAVSASAAPQLNIITCMPHSNDIRDLPANDSNIEEYPIWNITFYDPLHFVVQADNKIVETGTGPISLSLNLSLYENKYVNVNITIGKTLYQYKNIQITGLPPEVGIQYATIISYLPGQDQYLYAFQNHSELMYPDWEIYLFSSSYNPYKIYENGTLIASGHIVGSKTIYLNVTLSAVTLDISIGSVLYKYPDESIASKPLDKLYQKPPPPLVYTVEQYEYGLVKAFVASMFAVLIGLFTGKKYLIEKERREVIRI